MSDWKPPAFGTPVWMGIPAKDVTRASKFYDDVFKLPFKKDQDEEKYPRDNVNMFDLNPSLNLTGGIQKATDQSAPFVPGRGGVCLYWFVKDVDEMAPIIEKAGGKMLSEKTPEGEYGFYRYFEDTEGTVGAVYMLAGC